MLAATPGKAGGTQTVTGRRRCKGSFRRGDVAGGPPGRKVGVWPGGDSGRRWRPVGWEGDALG